MTKLHCTRKSENPCPVCGGHEWHTVQFVKHECNCSLCDTPWIWAEIYRKPFVDNVINDPVDAFRNKSRIVFQVHCCCNCKTCITV